MDSFNIFNVLNHLNGLVGDKFINVQSELNNIEIRFSKQLFNKIVYYMDSINDFIDGELDMDLDKLNDSDYNRNTNDISMKTDPQSDPDYEANEFKTNVL